MSKIIAVTSLSVSVEFSDGTSKAYPISSCLGFSPAVGMEVDVVIEGSKTIIRLVNVASKSQNSDDSIFYGGKEFFKTKSSKDNAEYNYDDIPTLKPFTANNEPFLRVNKIIYLLLTFFLGTIGIHRFYAGKIKSGIIYLLCSTVGVVLVIPPLIIVILVIIEFIKVLFSPSDDSGYFVLT